MTTLRNPQLHISDPLYEVTLQPPVLNECIFNYLSYTPTEMTSEQNGASFENSSNPVFRYVKINWDFQFKISQLFGGELFPEELAGNFKEDDVNKIMNAEFFNFNRSLQLILEDTKPEIRFDPQRFITSINSTGPNTAIKDQFKNSLKTKFDVIDDNPDDVEIFSSYISSIKEVLGDERVSSTFDDLVGYLKDASSAENQSSNLSNNFDATINTSPVTAFKFKISLNTKYAPSVAASGIASSGPFALELSDMLTSIQDKKNSSDTISGEPADMRFAESLNSQTTKDQIFRSFTSMNPTIDNIISQISLLLSGNVIDGTTSTGALNWDFGIRRAYEDLFSSDNINVSSQTTENALSRISKNIGKNMFSEISSLITDLVKPVGYRVNKTELRPSPIGDFNVVAQDSDDLFVYNSRIKSVNDFAIRYGSVYDYSISAIYELIIPYVGDNGDIFIKKVLVASEPSNSIRVVAEDFTPIESPPNIEIERTFNDKGIPTGIMLFWDHPPDIKNKIRGFRIYKRENLQSPFRLLQELQYQKPPVTHNIFYNLENEFVRLKSPNGILVELTDTSEYPAPPRRNYQDSFFINDRQFIYCVTAVDVHGNESPCSDQVTLDFNSGMQMICIRGCPLDYPNLFIDRRKITENVISNSIDRGQTKAVIFFDPVSPRLSGDLKYVGQSFTTGNKQGVFSGSMGDAVLKSNLNVYNSSVQIGSGRNVYGEEDGTDVFIFTADGGVVFDGISGEYDFIIHDKNNFKTAVVRTVFEYGEPLDSEDVLEFSFID